MTANLSSVLDGGRDHDVALIEVVDGGCNVFTYGDVRSRVSALARGLRARFARPDFRVAVLASNSANYVFVYFAVMRAGGTIVPFNPRASQDALDFLIPDAAIDLVLTDVPRQIASVDQIVIGSPAWDELHDAGSIQPAEVDDETIAQILYTSGSTGTPKGVPLSHSGQHWAVVEGAKIIRDPGSFRVMVAAPLFHMNALFNIKRSFFTGACVVLLPGFTPASFAAALATYRCDWVSGVPTMIAMLAQHIGDAVPREFANVRYLFIGSAPYGDALVNSARHLFPNAEFANFYGTTEAGPTVFGRHPDGRESPSLSCGYPLFPEMIRIVGDDGAVLEGPGLGVLHMRTPANMRGYLNRPEVTSAVLSEDGWYDSRDVVTRDADGFLYFLGRSDDMFNSGGHNIYPAEVEKVLEAHPSIAQAIVVPVPDALKHEVPVAFVVSRDGGQIPEAEVKAWFIEQAPAYLHPRRIFTLPTIPLAQTNKIDRARLKAMAREAVGRGGGEQRSSAA
ncbi:class I adenylate-forming enzyme family protein [Terrihabitans sp. B22-R8]|uniref:class I adenylate-forming enzyme family protein n=1 Tax=Terrihabitans sp. B22-R8 TaxID=3425128 RepID=UPI00403C6837